ncbi:hypothetical protein FRB90_008436 [Tulasnella sp. 427]|nr:hypothetical protein FRB90_008436 [Tulasnella sp. 427]
MAATLPSISTITSAPLPFYDPSKGSFKLPPLVDDARRGSILLDTDDALASYKRMGSHSRSSSVTSDAEFRGLSPFASSSASTSSRSPSPPVQAPIPPRIPHDTRPSASSSRRNSLPRGALPAFKLVPQPMLDPSKRPIRPTDALVVFPSTAGVSQAAQRKAKLLVGKDIETYFELQSRNNPGEPVPKAYAYKMVWERRGSQSQTFATALSKAEAGRRGSRADMMDLTEDE